MRTDDGRVSLRAVEADHVDLIVEYLAHPDLMGLRGIDGERDGPMSHAELQPAVEKFTKPEHGEAYGIWVDETLVGHTDVRVWWDVLSPEMYLVVAPDHRRSGIGAAAARLSLGHLFEDTPAAVVQTWMPEWNAAGIAFADGLGFESSGRVRRTGIRHGSYVDSLALHLRRAVWEEAPWR
jgi:RimJ/RimL family protein N-acetyltransferase